MELADTGKYDKAEEILNGLEKTDAVNEALEEVKDKRSSEQYEAAVSLLGSGKYSDGITQLEELGEYKDAAEIIEQAKYESYGFSAVKAVKKVLKNPDSMIVHEIHFYGDSESVEDMTEGMSESVMEVQTEVKDEDIDNTNEHFPVIIMHYGAQNGFGGNTSSYAWCSYHEDTGEYELEGITPELDSEDLDEDDDNYFIYVLSAIVINSYLENEREVGSINKERFDSVIKSSAYSAIKIID